MLAKDIIEKTLQVEGGYTNNPNDEGGETIWGITVATARTNGYTAAMRDMPRTTAIGIYEREFFVKPQYDKVLQIDGPIAAELYDSGVNCGTVVASKWLQTALNVLNREHQDYPDLTVDGQIGPGTLSALQTFIRLRKLEGEVVLLKILNCLQGAYYVQLATQREKNEDFIFGWFRNRVELVFRSV